MSPQEFLDTMIELLLPHVRTIPMREALFFQAFHRAEEDILPHVDYEGSAYQFAIHSTRLLLTRDPTGQLFRLLLNVLRTQVGITQHFTLDDLQDALPLPAARPPGLSEVVDTAG